MLCTNPKIKISTSAMQIISSLLTRLKAKSFCIHDSCLIALIEHTNIKNQHPLVITDLTSILGPFIQFGLDTKKIKKILQTAKLQNIKQIEFDDMFQFAKDNSKGERLLYLIRELGLASNFQIYSHTSQKVSIDIPALNDLTSIFKSKMDKEKVNFINQSNTASRFKDYWKLFINEDELETIHHIDSKTSLPIIAKIREESISSDQPHFVLRIPYFASATCRTEMEISGIKTTNNEYWIISEFFYKTLKVHIFEQAELIKFTPYVRSANSLETYIRVTNLKTGNKK